ncbi:MAG: thiamine pyrophosphate-dependent enzyme, partial [Phycisphaerales bacterium]|nr:thiamine pyrophosphate-dependent enzyme [Phycisphaerales bacterium]
ICENNGYSMGTAISRGTTMGHEITSKAAGYGMESAVINGMDALSVFNGMKPLADRCRETSRPVFVDMRTYRFKGHSMSDPRKYRTKEEEQKHEADDPIDRLAAQLINDQGMSKEEYDELIKDVRNEVREAMEWADASPPPPLEELYTDVYVETWGPYKGTSPPMMFLEEQAEAEAQKSGAKRRP